MQGLMWRAFNDDGSLTYTFIETIAATKPYYVVRLAGGLLFLSGMFVMAWNVWHTMRNKEHEPVPASAPAYWGESA